MIRDSTHFSAYATDHYDPTKSHNFSSEHYKLSISIRRSGTSYNVRTITLTVPGNTI